MSTYVPTPGSVAARAIDHLATLPAGTWLSSADLAGSIGIAAENLRPSIAIAVTRGVMQRRMVSPRRAEYTLVPSDPFDRDDLRGGKPLQRVVPAGAAAPLPKPGPSSAFDTGLNWHAPRKPRADLPAVADPAPAIPPVTASVAVVCAWFNTGDLLIEAQGQPPLRLDCAQAHELFRWLGSVVPGMQATRRAAP